MVKKILVLVIASLMGSSLTAMDTEQKFSHSDNEIANLKDSLLLETNRQSRQKYRAHPMPDKAITLAIAQNPDHEEDQFERLKQQATLAMLLTEAWEGSR